MSEPMSDAKFQSALSILVAKKMAHASPATSGFVIERLLHSAAFTIAIATAGEKGRMEHMLMGAEQYLTVTASGLATFGALMARGRGNG